MSISPDYYAILGVLHGADDVVIHAAHRVLAQKYRPDRFKGDRKEAEARLREIEEAFQVLSDPAKRREYDQRCAALEEGSPEYGEDVQAEDPMDAPGWRADWDLACRFYPSLRETEAQFRAISAPLAFTFCATLLETKRFPEAERIAQEMEQAYLGKYFGADPEILDFAKRLIVAGNAEGVRLLSRALQVLGASTPAAVIIDTLSRDLGSGSQDPVWTDAPPDTSSLEVEEAAPEPLEAAADDALLTPSIEVSEVPEEPSPAAAAPPEPEKPAPKAEKPAAPRPEKAAGEHSHRPTHKDSRKRSPQIESFLRMYRAGEGLDFDSAIDLVRALDGTVNTRKADAMFGDVRVEVRFRGQSIMFSSDEFVEWVQRKILPEALAKL